MATRIITTELERNLLIAFITQHEIPMTVRVAKGKQRSVEQNKLQRKWLNEAADQLQEYSAEEYRGYCKLHFAIPILRAEDGQFCEKYDRIIMPLTYEQKLEAMMVPLDLPVTRMMTTKQKTAYLDLVYQHFTGLGVQLTEPGP